MTERPRDYAYEALAEVTNAHPEANRGEINISLKSIREQAQIDDNYLLAAEIRDQATRYRAVMGDALLTPTALSKHWVRVRAETERPPKGTNLTSHKDDECPTCAGNRMVVVNLRELKATAWMTARGIEMPEDAFVEEYAPCPVCGPELTAQRRFDGSFSVPLDPARVREMMQK